MSDTNKYLKYTKQIRPNNHVKLLQNGREAYPAMLEAIANAKKYIFLETYILACDRIGWRFADALAERRRAGVEVKLLVDAIGSAELSTEFFNYLDEHEISWKLFNPVAPWRKRWGLNVRDHRKILVVDVDVGLIGGINVSLDYAPEEDGGEGWRDSHCEIRGPLVRDLSLLFLQNWNSLGGDKLEIKEFLSKYKDKQDVLPESQGTLSGNLLSNGDSHVRGMIQKAYLHAIRHATKSILITNAYFIPDLKILFALRAARKRGVHVEIMVPRDSDVKMVWYASKALYGRLLSWGIVIREWHHRMLHAKTAVIDEIWCTIGSSNLDHRSLLHNREANVVFAEPTLGQQFVEIFEADKAHTTRVVKEEFTKRPWKQKILEKLCYLFQYWL